MFDQRRRRVIQADCSELISLAEPQASKAGVAQVCRVCQYRIENRLQISRRTADNLEHLRCRGLSLQRLGKIVRAVTQFVKQPRVLDGDDGLFRKMADKLDLPVREFKDLLPINADNSD